MFGLWIWVKILWAYDMGAAGRETRVKRRCLPMSGLLTGTPCLMEKAWIWWSLWSEVAHECNRAMHFFRVWWSECMSSNVSRENLLAFKHYKLKVRGLHIVNFFVKEGLLLALKIRV